MFCLSEEFYGRINSNKKLKDFSEIDEKNVCAVKGRGLP